MLKIVAMTILLFSPSWPTVPSICCEITKAAEFGQRVSDSPAIPSLKYCSLVEQPRRYRDKLVRLSASWKFGFETTRLFDRECPEHPAVWLEFADDKQQCGESNKNREMPGPHDKEADVTVTGRLFGPGRFGHLGAYEYKFVVTCLEKIKITDSDLK